MVRLNLNTKEYHLIEQSHFTQLGPASVTSDVPPKSGEEPTLWYSGEEKISTAANSQQPARDTTKVKVQFRSWNRLPKRKKNSYLALLFLHLWTQYLE